MLAPGFLRSLLVGAALAAVACGRPVPPRPPLAAATAPAAAAVATTPAPPPGLRDVRYCEVLIAERAGLRIAADIYSTAGVGECPLERFRDLDPGRLADELGATRVVLKGPRYWTVDRFEGTPRVLETAPRRVGGLDVRRTARLEFSVFEAGDMQRPYRVHVVPGDGAWVFAAGQRVHELVAPDGAAYAMLSYSAQKAPLTAPSLGSLGQRLRPPAGWAFRSRRLAAELRAAATDGAFRVIQDELDNAYVGVTP